MRTLILFGTLSAAPNCGCIKNNVLLPCVCLLLLIWVVFVGCTWAFILINLFDEMIDQLYNRSSKYPFVEMTVGRIVRLLTYPFENMSIRLNFHLTKCPLDEIQNHIFYSAKFPFEKNTDEQITRRKAWQTDRRTYGQIDRHTRLCLESIINVGFFCISQTFSD